MRAAGAEDRRADGDGGRLWGVLRLACNICTSRFCKETSHILLDEVERVLACICSIMGELAPDLHIQTILAADISELTLDDRVELL